MRSCGHKGNKIALIENLGVTLDQFDTIDFTGNDIRHLDNFPPLLRLKVLLASNCRIEKIGNHLQESLPNLESLILSRNAIADIGEIEKLVPFKQLRRLSLLDNPVREFANYRLLMIHLLPSLHILDFQRVRKFERLASQRLFAEANGHWRNVVSVSQDIPKGKDATMEENETREAKRILQGLLAQAKSLAEVNALEERLRLDGLQGVMQLANARGDDEQRAPKRAKMSNVEEKTEDEPMERVGEGKEDQDRENPPMAVNAPTNDQETLEESEKLPPPPRWTKTQLNAKKVAELKKLCQEMSLETTGRKQELVERLLQVSEG